MFAGMVSELLRHFAYVYVEKYLNVGVTTKFMFVLIASTFCIRF